MDIRIPNLGEGADSGTVVSVYVKEGDRVAKDQTPNWHLGDEFRAVRDKDCAGAGGC